MFKVASLESSTKFQMLIPHIWCKYEEALQAFREKNFFDNLCKGPRESGYTQQHQPGIPKFS